MPQHNHILLCGSKLHSLEWWLTHKDHHILKGWWDTSLGAHLTHISWHLPFHQAPQTLSSLPHPCLCSTVPPPCGIIGLCWPGTCLLPQSHVLPFHVPMLLFHASIQLTSFRDCLTPCRTLSISDPETLNANNKANHRDDQKNPQTFPKGLWKWTLLTLIENHWKSPFLNTWLLHSESFPGPDISLLYRVVHVKLSINIYKIKTVPSVFLLPQQTPTHPLKSSLNMYSGKPFPVSLYLQVLGPGVLMCSNSNLYTSLPVLFSYFWKAFVFHNWTVNSEHNNHVLFNLCTHNTEQSLWHTDGAQ